MLCQSACVDAIHDMNSLSLTLNQPISLISPSELSKRHTISSGGAIQEIEDMLNNYNRKTSTDQSYSDPIQSPLQTQDNRMKVHNEPYHQQSQLKSYWEVIEGYYINHLNTLRNEIDSSTQHNIKLVRVRDDLIQEILRLNQTTMELTTKHETLSRTIAEQENQISAFMYQSSHKPDSYPTVNRPGVTLVDVSHDNSGITPTPSIHKPHDENKDELKIKKNHLKKEHGLLRQISQKLTRKRRQAEDYSGRSENEVSSILTTSINEPIESTLLHRAVVMPLQDTQYSFKEKMTTVNKNKNISHQRKKKFIFGNDLLQQAKVENTLIPSIIIKCIGEVESRGLMSEGIYRKSGTYSQVKELQSCFDKNKSPKLTKYEDINVIASVLKTYIRELPSPLIPNDILLNPMLNTEEQASKIKNSLSQLPDVYYTTIKCLMQHLHRIHQHQSVNRMSSKNLAVIFGPTLIRFEPSENEEEKMKDMINTIEFMIMQTPTLFTD